MLTDKEIEELILCDYDNFVRKIAKELAELSIQKDLVNQIFEVSTDEVKSVLIDAFAQIRGDKIDSILKNEK